MTTLRWEVERAVLASKLSSQARLVAFVLLALCDAKTGVVPPDFTPSLTKLAKLTGLGVSTVKRALNELESGDWVVRERPEVERARADHERTQYRVTAPGMAQSGPGMAHTGPSPVQSGPSPRPTAGQGLGPERATNQNAFQTYNQNKQAGAEAFVTEATGASAEEAVAIVKRIANEREVRNMGGLLRHLAQGGDLRRYLTEHRAANVLAADADDRKIRQSMRACEHGMAGGDQPHSITGQIRCKTCSKIQQLATGWTA